MPLLWTLLQQKVFTAVAKVASVTGSAPVGSLLVLNLAFVLLVVSTVFVNIFFA